jgi:hypothetical protein
LFPCTFIKFASLVHRPEVWISLQIIKPLITIQNLLQTNKIYLSKALQSCYWTLAAF